MKIAILVYYFPPKWLAGTEIATYKMATHLARKGHEVHVITSWDEGLPKVHVENGFYIHRIPKLDIRFLGVITFWLKMVFEINNIKPNIVHGQSLLMGPPAWIAKKIFGFPYVVWGQGSDVYSPGWFEKLTSRKILRDADAVLALTGHMKKEMTRILEREIVVVPNGIDLEEFLVPTKSFNYSNYKTIIFVGRLNPVKGVRYLIKAMRFVLEKEPNCKLLIVGDGEERAELEALSVQLGIKESIQFAGAVPHEKVRTYLQQADVFVLPSLSEGFPLVILEAMACGLLIVATRVGGIPDILKDGINGYLVNT